MSPISDRGCFTNQTQECNILCLSKIQEEVKLKGPAFLSLLGSHPRDLYALCCLVLHLFLLEGTEPILPRPQSVLKQLLCANEDLLI